MLEKRLLPSWSEIFSRIGKQEPRRGRARCPIHNGDSPTSFAVNEEKGVFYCHVCHAGGDKIEFIMKIFGCTYWRACVFFGFEPGPLPTLNPGIERRGKIQKGLKAWGGSLIKELNFEHYVREKVITRALRRLTENPEDSWGWNWLSWALTGKESLEYTLDLLAGSENDQIEVFKHKRSA